MDEDSRYKRLALIGISFLAFTTFLDFTGVNAAIPFIQKDLKANILQLQWVANISGLILSMTMIALGKFADRWGRKRVFYIGVAIFAISAMGSALSPSIEYLILFRGFQGVGSSALFILSAALLTDVFSKHEYPKAAGIYGGITGIGLLIGPFFSGMMISMFSWRWFFGMTIPLLAGGFLFCFFSLRSINPERHLVKIPLIDLSLLVFGLGAFVYGIVVCLWISVSAGVLSLICLLFLCLKQTNPLLELRAFRNKMILLAFFSSSIAGISSHVFLFFDPLYLENVRHLTASAVGLFIVLIPFAQVPISFFFNFLLKKCGLANLFLISIGSGTLAFLLHRFIGPSTPLSLLAIPFLLLGVPWGLSNTGFITAVNREIPVQKTAQSVGTIATAWNIIGAVLLALSSVIFHKKGPDFIPAFHAATELNLAFAVLVLSTTLWTWYKLKKKRAPLP
jgi:MFS family permease